MAGIDHIIKIIELILREAELNEHPTAFLDIRTKTLRLKKIDPDELRKILKRLEKLGCISDIFSPDGNSGWEYIIMDLNNNHLLKFRVNTKQLLNYREDLRERYGKPQKQENIKIFISKDLGMYREVNGKQLTYLIKGKRFNLIINLRGGKTYSKELIGIQNQDKSLVSKEIRIINKNFQRKLDLTDDLIIHIKTGGYKLNTDKFTINFI